MSAYTKRTRDRPSAKRAKPWRRGRSGSTAAAPAAAEEIERPFEEPATAPQKLNISVEEPVAREPAAEDEEACGPRETERTPASDLH
ncbi:MAG TPA: hypothetical protein VEI03_14600 [Stellaceae bacterium]|nr:hypothetical protein [Stellaceae bacterium]